jgi:succinoglycan biosynthesis transport protein ExoP
MEARDFLDVLRRRWLAVVAVVVICTGAAAALEYHATPQYRADAKVYFAIKTSTTGTGNDLSQGSAYVQGQVLTYATLATTPTVLVPVLAELKLNRTPSRLAGQISASVLPNTVVVTVQATDPSPRLAASLANSVAQQLGVAVAALAPVDATGASRIVARTIATAPVPKVPATPKKKRNISAAFVGSLLLGIAAAMLLELLATQGRRDRRRLSRIDTPVLGEVSWLAGGEARSFAKIESGLYQAGADFERLRESLDFVLVDRLPKIVIVAGMSVPDDKSATALRLAFASAEAGTRTLLIDANLRAPTVAKRLGEPHGPGLSSVLTGRTSFDDVVVDFGSRLDVLTSGPTPPNPTYLLGSTSMEHLLKEMSGRYDLVIIDSSAVLAYEDTTRIVPYTSGVLLVAPTKRGLGSRRDANKLLDWSAVREASQELGPVTAVLGIVASGR